VAAYGWRPRRRIFNGRESEIGNRESLFTA
jgi:hypothetical protein